MKVLVLGSGGREHALAWKIGQSPQCEQVFLHPGNAGTLQAGIATLGDVPPEDIQAITNQAQANGVELVVIGPEALLAKGFGDTLRKEGFLVVGPNKEGAQLESSKVFSKHFMDRAKVPTASYFVVDSVEQLNEKLALQKRWPVVLKLDGLAAGKGVVIAESHEDIATFGKKVWQDKIFGEGPHSVVIESHLRGRELSYIGLCDGKCFFPLASATDYKPVGENNTGPNTGGMGSISPSPYFSPELETRIRTTIVEPILQQFKNEGLDYRGALYIGLMIMDDGSPQVLEFNARFGDPETQAQLLRLESDFITLLEHTARQKLTDCPAPQWNEQYSLYVVGAAEGYPESVKKGDTISGLNNLDNEVTVFFAGIKKQESGLVTNGGRVLGLGCLAMDVNTVRAKTYRNMERVQWRGLHYRKDIGICR